MKKTILMAIILWFPFFSYSQNAAALILENKDAKKITLGMYGQVDYNEIEGTTKGKLDVHRMVLLVGYNFTEKIQFLTEFEFEHVKEVFIEQAFLNYQIQDNVFLKAGLMLVPMGIINEYHESPTFFGVERPALDKVIVPTTWREIGVGISGKFDNLPLKYQAYIFNGFKSEGLRGVDGLRKGRQKGAKSLISSPTFSGKIDYYGIKGLRLGFSGYFGDTQTDKSTESVGAIVGVSMLGLDARYNYKKLKVRVQFITTSISKTKAYNLANDSDLGSKLQGWYIETGYNILQNTKKEKLSPFIRYEQFNTHAKTDGFLAKKAYNRTETTIGLNFLAAQGVAYKIDYQIKDDKTNTKVNNQFNAGIAIWF